MPLIASTNGSIDDRVFDLGLNILTTEANRLDICSSAPTTFTAATSTVSLGNRTSLSIGSPTVGSPSGRQVTLAAITTGGNVTANGTATHYAITDTVNSRLLAVGSLNGSQVVASGNTFTLPSFVIRLPGSGG